MQQPTQRRAKSAITTRDTPTIVVVGMPSLSFFPTDLVAGTAFFVVASDEAPSAGFPVGGFTASFAGAGPGVSSHLIEAISVLI